MVRSDVHRISGMNFWIAISALASAVLFIFAAAQAQAQTFSVLHSFTGGADGAFPYLGPQLTIGLDER